MPRRAGPPPACVFERVRVSLCARSPRRQGVFQLPVTMSWWHHFRVQGNPMGRQETSLQGTKAGVSASAGHSLSFLRLLGRPGGGGSGGGGGPGAGVLGVARGRGFGGWPGGGGSGVARGVLSNSISVEKAVAGPGPTAPCWLRARPRRQCPEKLDAAVAHASAISKRGSTAGSLGRSLQPHGGVGGAPGQWGPSGGLKSSLGGRGGQRGMLLVSEVRECRATGSCSRGDCAFGSHAMEDGGTGSGSTVAEQSPGQDGRGLSPSPGSGEGADGRASWRRPKEPGSVPFSALRSAWSCLQVFIVCLCLSPPGRKPHEGSHAAPLHGRSPPHARGSAALNE